MKGQKTGGRKLGSLNKVTNEVKTIIADIVANNLQSINEDIASLSPLERVNAITKLLPYVIPRQTDIATTSRELPIISQDMVIGFLGDADED